MEWLRKIEIPNRGGGPYLDRWPLIPRNRWFNVYLHRFWTGDDTRYGCTTTRGISSRSCWPAHTARNFATEPK